MSNYEIKQCTMEHLERYGEIYAVAFSGEPWNNAWKPENAVIHIKELLESKKVYGLEYVLDGKVVGFIICTSTLFHFGRVFDINDLAVDPAYQRRGIAKILMNQCLEYAKEQGMVGAHLITAGDSILPAYYERFGFKQESEVILMNLDF